MFKFCLLLFPGRQKADEMVEVFGSAVDTMAEEETAFQGVVFFRVFGKVSRKYFFQHAGVAVVGQIGHDVVTEFAAVFGFGNQRFGIGKNLLQQVDPSVFDNMVNAPFFISPRH